MSSIEFRKPIITSDDAVAISKQFSQEQVNRAYYAGGVPNVTFIVEFVSGNHIALRVGNLGYTRKEHLAFELDILSYLELSEFKWSPRLVPLLDGSGWIGSWREFPVIATKVIPGVTGDNTPTTPQLCFEIGKAIGEMRLSLAKYGGVIPADEDFWSRTERLLAELPTFSTELSWNIIPSVVTGAYESAKKIIQTTFCSDEVVHTDVWQPNVLVLDGHLSGIIDFDDLSVGPGILDLAAAIGEFGYDRESDMLIVQNVIALVQGFNKTIDPKNYEERIIFPLIEASYCSWFACNAVHRVTFEESEIYYRRINKLQSSPFREQLDKQLLGVIKNAQTSL
ncbi:hypothetical protein FACS1894190_12480 [Spirochaetia bacterium]|nr:hypothetical protein FACS1894190_12480 [Spirochaetia bacterium]